MKPRLVLGLGGPLSGDDAVGLRLAERLAAEPRLPADVDVIAGGTDLLRLGDHLAGRTHVVLIDAVLADDRAAAEPLVVEHPLPGLDRRQLHAHHLSAGQALDLLRLARPELARTRYTWFLVPVYNVDPGADLSPTVAAALSRLAAEILRLLDAA
jgi:hydrogenase maturation protease